MTRSIKEVFKSHLELRLKGDVEEDIKQNYSEEVALISNHGKFYGHHGVRESAELLKRQLPDSTLTYEITDTERDMAYLIWSGKSLEAEVKHGVDSFLIKDGKILVQTIYYELEA
jgi:hypothetical protein